VPDQLYLSLWLHDFTPDTMLRHFEQMLGAFPFSKLRPGIGALKIYALELTEPPVLEHAFAAETDVDTVIAMCREFENPDCAYIVDGSWELWKYSDAWKLGPSPVSLAGFGPLFENEEGDHLRIDFGSETHYLPQPHAPDSARAVHSNIRGMLRLIAELEEALPVERKKLWSESEDNFAERVESALLDGE